MPMVLMLLAVWFVLGILAALAFHFLLVDRLH